MNRETEPPDEAVNARQYAFLGFLTLLNVMNFVDRQLLASFANFIVPDLGLGWGRSAAAVDNQKHPG